MKLVFLIILLVVSKSPALEFTQGQHKIDDHCKISVTKTSENISEVRLDFRKESSKESHFKTGYDVFLFDDKNQKMMNADKTYCPTRNAEFKKLDDRFFEFTLKCGGLINGQTKKTVYVLDSVTERFIFAYVHRKAAFKFTPDPNSHTHSGPIKTTKDHFWCMDESVASIGFLKYYSNELIPDNVRQQIARKVIQTKIKQASIFPAQNLSNSDKTKNDR